MTTTLILLIVIGAVALIGVGMYNGLVRGKNKVDSALSDISVYLKKRYDLIPNLVNTVKGYAAHESQTLENVIKMRNQAMAVPEGDVAAMAQAQVQLGSAMRSIFALAENYPDLKANANFMSLQQSLQTIESDLEGSRRYYNATVRDYNTSIESFPQVLFAKSFGFFSRDFFELDSPEESAVPNVQF